MTTEMTEITPGNQNETLGLIAEAVHRIDHRTAQMELEWRELLTAWTSGGLKGMRQAATLIRGRHG